LLAIPKGACLLNLKHAICQSFSITPKQFYYILSRINKKTTTFDEYIAQIEKEGFEVFISRETRESNQLPMTLVAVSPDMKKAFAVYGERVSFDLTFRLIKNRMGTDEWKVGVFLGLSSTNKIVPFGVAITLSTTKDAYMEIFKMFFEAVGGQPKVIISDEERGISAAL
jgi:hypothetical protein